jgi:hypothetical protein
MTRNAVASPDGQTLTVNFLCTSCMKRVLRVEPNPVMALEMKTPSPTIIHNPHTNRKGKQRMFAEIRACNVPITQEQIDEATNE